MTTFAIDIETASPFRDGDVQVTENVELVAVALGHRPAPDEPVESDVLFRAGGWDDEHTADLLERVVDWIESRGDGPLLTFNGAAFDVHHLRNWADDLAESGVWPGAAAALDRVAAEHVDLIHPATDEYEDRLYEDQDAASLRQACYFAGIEAGLERTRYADYDLPAELLDREAIDEEYVEGRHVGLALGELYVELLAARETKTFAELERLLADYARSDVAPLFELADRLDAVPVGRAR